MTQTMGHTVTLGRLSQSCRSDQISKSSHISSRSESEIEAHISKGNEPFVEEK